VPRKVRQLKADLKKAGFVEQKDRGKGSHTVWEHPLLSKPVVIAGHDGDDAKSYQEREVREAIQWVKSQ
jgi:predicted RNA binding protein YcfA (HicA-like mRNA interferase family)